MLHVFLVFLSCLVPLCLAYLFLTSFMSPPIDYSASQNYTIRLSGISHPLNPPVRLLDDPYLFDKKPLNQTGYCAVEISRFGLDYFLHNVSTELDALSRDWKITHKGHCGVCSTLKDLAVYMQNKDLTAPVRSCGIFSWLKPYFMECMRNLGFTPPCSDIWYYNARNTAKHCFGICLISWITGEPYNKKDGSLNDCLKCDEDKSGPWFKLYSGRTRRNSGIRSEIDRNRTDIYNLTHHYFD